MADIDALEKDWERSGDAEAARIALTIARNRRAAAVGIVSGLAVASAIFWGIGYGFPNQPLGAPVVLASLGVGAFVGLVVQMVARARGPVFERVSSAPLGPVDPETRALEARMQKYGAQNLRAMVAAGVTFVVLGPIALAAYSHFAGADEPAYLRREIISTSAGSLVMLGALLASALAWWILRPKVDVLAELGGVSGDRLARESAPSKEDLEELRQIASDVRRAQRGERIAHVVTTLAGVGTAASALFVLDRWYASSDSYGHHVSGGELVFACALGVGAAVLVSRALAPKSSEPAPAVREGDRDWFHDTLRTTSALTLQVPTDVEAMLARFFQVANNRWSVLDGGGASLCDAAEVELSFTQRMLPFRARTIAIRDLDRTPMSLRRPFGWLGADWEVLADGATLGSVSTSFFGRLSLRDGSGKERMRIGRTWLVFGGYAVTRAGTEISRIERSSRRALLSSTFEVPGLRVDLPEDASLEDRRLLLAAALVLDLA